METKNRSTIQRKIILEELRKVHTHPSAYELYKLVSKKIPNIGLATVYRNLDYLEKKKLGNKTKI
ncbi:transcriptional repressor [Patescibacteria group bacterium]|nr:transcriptional repressor [Patescibacteria group bacterium]